MPANIKGINCRVKPSGPFPVIDDRPTVEYDAQSKHRKKIFSYICKNASF
jgi:hypothetical protein